MDDVRGAGAADLVRWTFTANAAHKDAIEDYLIDQGLDVSVRDDGQFVVLWDEPGDDRAFDMVVEDLWALNGATFEITHEAFGRLDLLVFHPADGTSDESDRAVA